jgi:hypothetical protein
VTAAPGALPERRVVGRLFIDQTPRCAAMMSESAPSKGKLRAAVRMELYLGLKLCLRPHCIAIQLI